MVVPYGHEVGSHGMSHQPEHGFDVLSFNDQVAHLQEFKQILEDISGEGTEVGNQKSEVRS